MKTVWTPGDATDGVTYVQKDGMWNFAFKVDIWERIHLNSNFFSCEQGKVYKIHIDGDAGKSDYRITIHFSDGNPEKRGYRRYIEFDDEIRVPDGMNCFEIKVIIGTRVDTVATLGSITYEYIRDHQPKKVRLCAISDDIIAPEGKSTPHELVKAYADTIDVIARKEKPDLVVLTEHYSNICSVPIALEEKFVDSNDIAVTMLSDKAKEHAMYVCASVHILENGKRYNRALLFGRDGNLVAKYDKTHLTMNEMEFGIVPGDGPVVADTDIGRLGFAICWDLWYPELVSLYYKENVDILLNPSRGGEMPQAHAASYVGGMFIVASQFESMNRIQDKAGKTVSENGNAGYAVATVDITEPEWVPGLAVGNNYGEGRNIYRKDRRPDLYSALAKKY